MRLALEEINIFEQNAPVDDDALPPVLDAEATPTPPTCCRHVTQDEAIADMQVMLQEMERHYRKRPIIYTTLDFYEANLSNGALTDYPIWVRSTGRVPGIGGNVDKDAFYGTKEQWDAFLREPGVRPAQTGAAGPAPASAPQQTAAAQPQSLSPSRDYVIRDLRHKRPSVVHSDSTPARWTALIPTKTSLPPSSGWMKPKPFVALNHFTVSPVKNSNGLIFGCFRGSAGHRICKKAAAVGLISCKLIPLVWS